MKYLAILHGVNGGELEIGLCHYASSLLYPKSFFSYIASVID
jgi:hypothetical protein